MSHMLFSRLALTAAKSQKNTPAMHFIIIISGEIAYELSQQGGQSAVKEYQGWLKISMA